MLESNNQLLVNANGDLIGTCSFGKTVGRKTVEKLLKAFLLNVLGPPYS